MKKIIGLLLVTALVGTGTLFAQEASDLTGNNERQNGVSDINIGEGVQGFVFYGALTVAGWYGGGKTKDGHRNHGADTQDDDTFIGYKWNFSKYSGVQMELFFSDNWSNNDISNISSVFVGLNMAQVYTDVLGEFGVKDYGLVVAMGRNDWDSDFMSYGPMGTGDGNQRDVMSDKLNWRMDFLTKNELFPIDIALAGDLDFGWQDGGETSTYNNHGASGFAEIKSSGAKFGENKDFGIDWNLYYQGTLWVDGAVGDGDGATIGGGMTAAEDNAFEQHLGMSIGFSQDINEKFLWKIGTAWDYSMVQGGGYHKGYDFSSIDWQAGLAFTMKDQFLIGLGVSQNNFNRNSEYAENFMGSSKKNDRRYNPFADQLAMNVGLELRYLGLLQTAAHLEFYSGVGYKFGDYFTSADFLNTYAKGNARLSQQLSVDVGMVWRPLSAIGIYMGYAYGSEDLEVPNLDYNTGDVNSWGQVYVKAVYTW